MPTPRMRPSAINTTQVMEVALPTSSQPQETKSHTRAAVNAAISTSPIVPIACIMDRHRKIHSTTSPMPTTACAGVKAGKLPRTQWK